MSVSFFYRYQWGEQNKEYACGTWPRKPLTDIRKARNQARALIDEQINPQKAHWPEPAPDTPHSYPEVVQRLAISPSFYRACE